VEVVDGSMSSAAILERQQHLLIAAVWDAINSIVPNGGIGSTTSSSID
jgi:hypothetical protein